MLLYILLIPGDSWVAQDVSRRGGSAGVGLKAVEVLDAVARGPPLFLRWEGHHWVRYLEDSDRQQTQVNLS